MFLKIIIALATYFIFQGLIIINNFSLYNRILDFNKYIRTYIASSIPNVHRDLRIHLLDECYNLTRNMFYSSYTKGNIRMKHIIDLRVNLSVLDYLLDEINSISCVKNKRILSSINKLSDIKNIIYGWMLNEEKRNQKYI